MSRLPRSRSVSVPIVPIALVEVARFAILPTLLIGNSCPDSTNVTLQKACLAQVTNLPAYSPSTLLLRKSKLDTRQVISPVPVRTDSCFVKFLNFDAKQLYNYRSSINKAVPDALRHIWAFCKYVSSYLKPAHQRAYRMFVKQNKLSSKVFDFQLKSSAESFVVDAIRQFHRVQNVVRYLESLRSRPTLFKQGYSSQKDLLTIQYEQSVVFVTTLLMTALNDPQNQSVGVMFNASSYLFGNKVSASLTALIEFRKNVNVLYVNKGNELPMLHTSSGSSNLRKTKL